MRIKHGVDVTPGGLSLPASGFKEYPWFSGVASGVGDLSASFVAPAIEVATCDTIAVQLEYTVVNSPVGNFWFFGSNRAAPAAITVSGTALTAQADWTLLSGQGPNGIAIPVAASAPTLASTPPMFRIDHPGFLWLCGVYLATSGGSGSPDDLMNAFICGVTTA